MTNRKGLKLIVEETDDSSAYNADVIAQHFDEFGIREWERLTQTPAHEVALYVHSYYLEKYISKGERVLEIGAGAGRFTQVLAELGADITVADLSHGQLELNKRFASEFGFDRAIRAWHQVDICDLSQFESNSFDHVVVYGGPFSYVLDKRDVALKKCLRVLRPNGLLLFSVMSLWGSAHGNLVRVLETPVTANQKITTTGDISPRTFPERSNNFMHLFRAGELKAWLSEKKLEILDLSASSCLALTWGESLRDLRKDSVLWNELLRMELEACIDEGCLGMGTHIIAVVRKPKRKM
jgi:2-polyprenyl-3-methyl-5-hydroxy-6-metoxy-1,4-benzoquinol methylase